MTDVSSLQVLQSSEDPSYLVITDQENYFRAVQGHQANEPNDQLIALAPDLARQALSSVPDLETMKSCIGMMGFYGHSTC